jgi:probable HAF family extracellular repeat protein
MKKEGFTHFALSLLALLALILSTSPSEAQNRLTGPRDIHHQPPVASQGAAPVAGTISPVSPTYTFTALDYPHTFTTVGFGINSGATTSKIQIVGALGNNTTGPIGYTGGFRLLYTQPKGSTGETFYGVNFAGVAQQAASAVNDAGVIVGYYADSLGVIHGYELSGSKFTTLNVSFSGALGTASFGINNSGEIVGNWQDATTSHGFLLNGGVYTSLDYPGALFTVANAINNNGQIVGFYSDASGVYHGFSLSGGTYTSIDPPGSTQTEADGVNDAGEIVGTYCLTSECAANDDTFQAFVLNSGTFTTITIPGATATGAVGVNNKGDIVGAYFDSVGNSGFLAFPK